MRHPRRSVSSILLFVFCGFYYTLMGNWKAAPLHNTFLAIAPTVPADSSTKTILIWNSYSRFELQVFGQGRDTFVRHGCAVSDCFITRNKSYLALNEFDAVIFNMPPLSIHKFPLDRHRRPDQRYVFFTQETPAYIGEEMSKFNGLFNWTMTYSTRSDIPYIYGKVVALSSAPSDDSARRDLIRRTHAGVNHASGKSRLVAWFTSHCFTQSRREKYVAFLRKYIRVDIYGGCYTMKCPMNASSFLSEPPCYDMLDAHYKFYLAFENSVCDDYATEKLYDILQRRVVPIVMGGANYSALAPPHSYIDALQYSPRELAAYLKLLNSNDRLYNEYFWWKPHFSVETRYPVMESRALCQLCRKLHTDRNVSVYEDLTPWSKKNQCRNPSFKGVHLFWGII